jgi:hypothetical protein
MESTGTFIEPGHSKRWRWMAYLIAAMLLASMVATPAISAQESTEAPETPDVVIPGTGDEEEPATPAADDEEVATEEATAEVTEAPETSTSGTSIQVSGTDPGNPAALAHGLAFLTGDQAVWQVQELEPESSSEATAEITNASLVYQVEGSSIIRNDVTGKRALLDPGEALFKAGGDAYTTFAESADSLIWVFEVVEPNEVSEDAFYESPLIDDYDEGVFDLVMVRYVLEPGETADVPDHTGPALVMSTNGDIDIESGGLGLLATGDGQLITEDATVTNNSSDSVEYVLAAFGSEVADTTSAPGSSDPAATEAATDGTTTDDETPVADTPEETEAETEATEPAQEAADGDYQASINITAQADLYVVIVADGVTVFDGPIPSGGQSGIVVGSTFEVYTSHGAATLFTDACGNDYFMGFEEGEANYTLVATAESCSP